VGRPLRRLDAAAVRLGEGSLSERAPAHDGPAEVQQLAATFNQMAGRLESLLASQRNVLADVSHQLRTPLAALRLRLELMRQDAGGASEGAAGEPESDLDGLLAEVNRLSQLVDGLLAVARAENTTPAPEVIDVAAVTAGRVQAWLPVAEEAHIGLTLAPVAAWALATAGHLEQILDNLLSNAIEATPAGGSITVTMARLPESVRIVVADTGPGMSEAAREQALRRFWSAGLAEDGSGATPGDRHASEGRASASRLPTGCSPLIRGRCGSMPLTAGGWPPSWSFRSRESADRRRQRRSAS
jgi:signal transduction histidine kinase